jgi:putative membrane protein
VNLGAPLIALGYAAYLLYAARTGALYFYIHPLYVWPTVATGLVLLVLGGLSIWELIRAGKCEDSGHAHGGRPGARSRPGPGVTMLLGLLALPLVLGFGIRPQPLSALAAGQRGMDLAAVTGAETLGAEAPVPFALGTLPESFTIKDWVKAFHVDPEPGRHAGQSVRVTGFVHRDERLPSNWFLVARFVVKCCAVDAQPVGLPVRVDGEIPESGRWVSVEGVWEVAEVRGDRRAVIGAIAVVPVARPDQPYLY